MKIWEAGKCAGPSPNEQIGRERLPNDALIAMSAEQPGNRLIAANERDFSRLAEFRAFQWQVRTF